MADEIWLRGNRRAVVMLACLLGVVLAAGGGVAAWLAGAWWPWLLAGSFVGAVAAGLLCWRWGGRPRLKYSQGELLVGLSWGQPIAVPIEIVECFFLGQGPNLLPVALQGPRHEATETATLIVRLAEAAQDWHHRDVAAQLGQWCEGYIILRGTWCEPLHAELIGNLNRRLVAAHRRLKDGGGRR